MDGVHGRLFAALRVLLVAVSVCLMGAAPFAERAAPEHSLGSRSAHVDPVELPEPAIAEARDEDPLGAEDDELTHRAHGGLTVVADAARRLRPIRGPPAPPPALGWRPRSSRGPPA